MPVVLLMQSIKGISYTPSLMYTNISLPLSTDTYWPFPKL